MRNGYKGGACQSVIPNIATRPAIGRHARLKGRHAPGFTLLEVLVVVVILGILAAVIVPKIMGRPEQARRVKALVDIKSVETALSLYKIDNGKYPDTEQGLTALVVKPDTGDIPRNWKSGGYLDKIPKDPWGKEYIYISPGVHGDFDLSSYGSDGEEGGEGDYADINNWSLE
ncbi:General secretion pathway protein G [hydrothermal vent metagenome]|uniref:Type II secretion system core protein G n=1 Tax=hydrothermal vent metagenome TaxID=652676 RepID=A0A3B1BLU2_9ZZZZ